MFPSFIYLLQMPCIICSIKNAEASRTFKQILRVKWPLGAFTYTDILSKDPDFVFAVIEEFKASFLNTHTHIYIYSSLHR